MNYGLEAGTIEELRALAGVQSEYLLQLPYPISANRYWRTRVIQSKDRRQAPYVSTYVSTEAKLWQHEVRLRCLSAGITAPLQGKVNVEFWLYPHRPLDWERRARRDAENWDVTVQCIDLDNTSKVLMDALKQVAFTDDKMVFGLSGDRVKPDEKGERLVVRITQSFNPCTPTTLFEE